MEELLRKILSQDKTLLSRRDELIAILDEQVPGRLAREYNPIKRALTLNVGEIFATGNEDREAAISKATEILTQSGLQETRVKTVIDTFVKVLDWDKEPSEETPAEAAIPDFMKDSPKPTAETRKVIKETPPPVIEETPPPPPRVEISPPPRVETPPPQYQNPPQYQQQYQTQPPQPANNSNTLKAIIGVLVLVLAFVLIGKSGDDSSESQNNSAQEEEQNERQDSGQKVADNKPQHEPYLDAKTELSLNGVDLGTPLSQVVAVFGDPNSAENEGNRIRYHYSDIEVVFNDNYLSAFVTYHPKYKTAKGLHVGSTYGEVVEKYGSAPHIMELGDLMLYEYDYNTIRGEHSLLRFAVSKVDNRVNYISMRVLYPETSNSSSNSNNDNSIPQNVQQAANAFLAYHESITSKNFRRAYDLQTYSRKQTMGDFDTFSRGYSNTLKSEITALNLVANNGNTVTLSYTLEAVDFGGGDTRIYRTFTGEVEMVNDSGVWKINSVRSSKISESRGR